MADELTPYQIGQLSLGSVDSALGFGLGIMNFNAQQQNLDFERAWRQKVYDETKEREDTAIQRRIADAFNAGVSPLAVLGSGASASAGGASMSMPSAPQLSMGAGLSHIIPDTATLGKIRADIDNVDADTLLKQQTIEKIKNEASYLAEKAKLTKEEVASMSYDNILKKIETDLKSVYLSGDRGKGQYILSFEEGLKRAGFENFKANMQALEATTASYRNIAEIDLKKWKLVSDFLTSLIAQNKIAEVSASLME